MSNIETTTEIRSKITASGQLHLSLESQSLKAPGSNEVVVKIEATPINPSDLFLMFGPADITTFEEQGNNSTAAIPQAAMPMVQARLDQALETGSEGAGTVVAAGDNPAAKALIGKTVGVFGSGIYSQYVCVDLSQVNPMPEGVSAEQAASNFVNPMTALAMLETARSEGHSAMINTAAASNLGQMINRLCMSKNMPLVNVVRSDEQATLLKDAGAKYAVNLQAEDGVAQLAAAIEATKASIAFDATGGGNMPDLLLMLMEKAASKGAAYSRYGSNNPKQVYVYGKLDRTPIQLTMAYGMTWNVAGWLVMNQLAKFGHEKVAEMKQKIANEITTTFASNYSHTINLKEALSKENILAYTAKKTGQKYLIKPHS